MKTFFLIAVAGVLGYFAYQRMQAPAEIVNPVFAEIRVTADAGSREVEAAIFGKTADAADCQRRAAKIWDALEADCPACTSKSVECKTTLEPRFAKFFDDVPSSVAYLSINHSNRDERDVRMIFWGVTVAEGNLLCDKMKQIFERIHSGPMTCVRPIGA
jgi:hypothetical protein